MDRKEYKEYFNKYYKIPLIAIDENGNKKPVDEKKRMIMDNAIKSLGDWYDNYFDLLFRKSAIKEMNDNTMSKTIESPFARATNIKLSRTQAATIIINRYFDFLVMANCP